MITILCSFSNFSWADCISAEQAGKLATAYIPFQQGPGANERKPAGYFFETYRWQGKSSGVHVSCDSEVSKMVCDLQSGVCDSSAIKPCIKLEEATDKISHAIRGGQIAGKLFGRPDRAEFNYVFFLESLRGYQERLSAQVGCDGEIKVTSCQGGSCSNVPLMPWKTPETVRDLKAISEAGRWYYCERGYYDGTLRFPGPEMIINVKNKGGSFSFNLNGEENPWYCQACQHVKKDPNGGLPLECDADELPVQRK